jgi:hypothetical protein
MADGDVVSLIYQDVHRIECIAQNSLRFQMDKFSDALAAGASAARVRRSAL